MPCDRRGPCLGVITAFTIVPSDMLRPFVVDSLTKRASTVIFLSSSLTDHLLQLRGLTPYSKPSVTTPLTSSPLQVQNSPPPLTVLGSVSLRMPREPDTY
jgi:hypothetical protein